MQKRTLDKMVRYCLREYPATRNSDITLTQQVWQTFYPQHIVQNNIGKQFVALDKLFELPREDNVKRVRAKIQNVEKQYLPTDPKIAEKRAWNMEEWRYYLNYPVGDTL